MKIAALLASLIVLIGWVSFKASGMISARTAPMEFVGPFATWINVKTSCGATGNGTTDDTSAIQTCLNGISSTAPVLYFPAGTYKISTKLSLAAQQYISLMGQDPATTQIIWAGASGGVMLYLNGVAFSRIDRITFNGAGVAGVAVDQSKADGSSNYFDTGNEYADDVFENAGIGLRCGQLGFGCAETSMLRSQYLNNATGIAMRNANALDMWVWYSLFQGNGTGITNLSGAGAFSVYNSVFLGSTSDDISYGNTGVFVFRNNYSAGSNTFIGAGGTGAPDNVTIQGNTILDTSIAASIHQDDPGPVVLIDNVIRTSPSASSFSLGSGWSATAAGGPAVIVGDCNGVGATCTKTSQDLFSMGNTFTVGTGTCTVGTAGSGPASPAFSPGHCHEINDTVVSRGSVNPIPPSLPGTPPNLNRAIFEASPTGNSGNPCTSVSPCDPQTAITQAAAGCVNNVAHIQVGTYSISTMITVPANCPVQIIGDGYYSALNWSGSSTANPVLKLLGPSQATLSNFSVSGNSGASEGIEVDGSDQVGSEVFLEQPLLSASAPNMFVDSLDNTLVEIRDSQAESTASGPSVNVVGGTSAAAGTWLGGATNVFAGISAVNSLNYQMSNGAHFAIQGNYNASGNDTVAVSGIGAFSYDGSIALPASGTPTLIGLSNFTGIAGLSNLYTQGNVSISGNASGGQVLGVGLVGPSSAFFGDTASPAPTSEFLAGAEDPTPGAGGNSSLPEVNCCSTPFLTTTLNQLRTTQPTPPTPRPSGITNVGIYRVFVKNATTGIHLVH